MLGSGSGGNCTVVRMGGRALLIDAGFGPLTTARRLRMAGMELTEVRAVCLTHLDQDHFRPQWLGTLLDLKIHVHLHEWHVEELLGIAGADRLQNAGLLHPFGQETFEPLPGCVGEMRVRAVHLPHDMQGTAGFRLDCAYGRMGYATDLGHVPDALIEGFAGVDFLALESNYDPEMQLKSSRPLFLKRRIMGHLGHLSNQQAFEAVQRIVDRSPCGQPRQIVLLHRSRQCNHPTIVKRVFGQDERLMGRVVLAEQKRRTRWFRVRAAPAVVREQLRLF